MTELSRTGVLLVNLGTPDSPTVADVRRYLAEFLGDPLVIDIPGPLRWLLLHGAILRVRPRRSAAAYRTIWTDRGSPLRFHGDDLAAALSRRLGDRVAGVELAMRYGRPAAADAARRLRDAGARRVVVVPLFPQYSKSAWQSASDHAVAAARGAGFEYPVVVPPFFANARFLDAFADDARPVLEEFAPDRVLLSFHGLPKRHCAESGGPACFAQSDCCDALTERNSSCYRAQCFATAAGLVSRLGVEPGRVEVAFQSRLTRNWIRPFTDERVTALPSEGARRVAVLFPSFVADCLETLEEIGGRAAADFRAAGGDELRLVPCLNASPTWIDALSAIVGEHLSPPDHIRR